MYECLLGFWSNTNKYKQAHEDPQIKCVCVKAENRDADAEYLKTNNK